MGHQSWTASSIGDPVTEILESEITNCTPLLWPAWMIKANTRTMKASKTAGLRGMHQLCRGLSHAACEILIAIDVLGYCNNMTACHHSDGTLSLKGIRSLLKGRGDRTATSDDSGRSA